MTGSTLSTTLCECVVCMINIAVSVLCVLNTSMQVLCVSSTLLTVCVCVRARACVRSCVCIFNTATCVVYSAPLLVCCVSLP